MRKIPGISALLLPLGLSLLAAWTHSSAAAESNGKDVVNASIDRRQHTYAKLAREIWEYAEVGYQEEKSSGRLREELRAAGFEVKAGVAGIPTAFVATYGSGGPVIGLLAEFDALPGITQDDVPERRPRSGADAGHACGHHLFGAASTAAAVAVRDWMEESGVTGTVRLYGTPAEEGGAGKVYMVRAGLFDDVDAVLHWHPGDRNDASPHTSLANRSAKFRFHGLSTHAAGAPERGRSALDGVEAMNLMVNMLREHVPSDTRIHYVITEGGKAPNVVPDFAEVYYYVRHPSAKVLEGIWERVVHAAEGAALGTGTTMEHEIIHGIHSLLPNDTLARRVYENMLAVGGVHYDTAEQAFAEKLARSFSSPILPLGSQREIQPYKGERTPGSTDVGDVSWTVPTAGLTAATWVPGTSAHSWQAIAAGGTSIGTKGMLVAARTLAMTAVDLYTSPEILDAARREFDESRGPDFVYRALLGDRDPPLDYRK